MKKGFFSILWGLSFNVLAIPVDPPAAPPLDKSCLAFTNQILKDYNLGSFQQPAPDLKKSQYAIDKESRLPLMKLEAQWEHVISEKKGDMTLIQTIKTPFTIMAGRGSWPRDLDSKDEAPRLSKDEAPLWSLVLEDKKYGERSEFRRTDTEGRFFRKYVFRVTNGQCDLEEIWLVRPGLLTDKQIGNKRECPGHKDSYKKANKDVILSLDKNSSKITKIEMGKSCFEMEGWFAREGAAQSVAPGPSSAQP